MNNNYNPNGQFGGWGQYQQGGYNTNYYNYYNEQYLKQQEKQKDKKILKTMGNWFGISIICYTILSYIASVVILLLSRFFPKVSMIFSDTDMMLAYQIIGTIIFILVPFAIAYAVLKKKKLAGILPFGTTYNKKASIGLTMMFVPVMILSSTVINLISSIIQQILGITFKSGLEDIHVIGIKGFFIATLSIAVVPAILEEVVIRGIILQPLRRFGDKFAIVSSALIFAIMHGNMVQIPYTLVAGALFGYLVVKTGSIWPSIILHFINNFYSVVVTFAYDNASEAIGGVVSVICVGLFILCGIAGGMIYSSLNYKEPLKKGVDSLKTGEKTSALFVNAPMIIAFIILLIQTISMIEF